MKTKTETKGVKTPTRGASRPSRRFPHCRFCFRFRFNLWIHIFYYEPYFLLRCEEYSASRLDLQDDPELLSPKAWATGSRRTQITSYHWGVYGQGGLAHQFWHKLWLHFFWPTFWLHCILYRTYMRGKAPPIRKIQNTM